MLLPCASGFVHLEQVIWLVTLFCSAGRGRVLLRHILLSRVSSLSV